PPRSRRGETGDVADRKARGRSSAARPRADHDVSAAEEMVPITRGDELSRDHRYQRAIERREIGAVDRDVLRLSERAARARHSEELRAPHDGPCATTELERAREERREALCIRG